MEAPVENLTAVEEARKILGKEFDKVPDHQIEELSILFHRLAAYYIDQYVQEKIQKKIADKKIV